MTYDDNWEKHLDLLKEYSRFSDDGPAIEFEFQLDEELPSLRNDYSLDEVAGQGDEISRLTRLMEWTHQTVTHDGRGGPRTGSARTILEHCAETGKGVSCAHLAHLLMEVFLAMGFPARSIMCYPYDYLDGENHVVTVAWCPQAGKWIMFDPSCDLTVANSRGVLLSPGEMRQAIVDGERLTLRGSEKEKPTYIAYMAKNLFHLESARVFAREYANIPFLRVSLAPLGFDALDFGIKRLDAQMERYKDDLAKNPEQMKWVESMKTALRSKTLYIHNPNAFWAAPKALESVK